MRPLIRLCRAAPGASLAFGVFAACAVLACSSNSDGNTGDAGPSDTDASGSCPDIQPTCPAEIPSYAKDVAPIVQNRCFPCHAPGGVEAASHNLSTYDGLYRDRVDVLDQIHSCRMPKAPAPALTQSERAIFLNWLVCHAPNN